MVARSLRSGGRAERSLVPPLADGLLAAFLFVVFEFADTIGGYNPIYVPTTPHVVWAVIGGIMTLSVAWRRRHPFGVWVITSVGAALLLAFIGHLDPYALANGWQASPLVVFPAPVIALYSLASTSQERGRLAFAGSEIAFGLLMFGPLPRWRPVHVYENGPPGLTPAHYEDPALIALAVAGMLATAWALGETVRARRDSAQVRRVAAEAEKAEHDRAVAAEERARIARELHDITAHHISVVTLQAGTARLLAESGQPPSAELLRGIETSSRQAMTEIRQALGVIRSTPDGAAPLPGLARLPDLTTQMHLAGLAITTTGDPGTLPGSLDLTAYRIVQEGLTNIARHSTAQTAHLRFHRTPTTIHITITDPGPPRATTPGDETGGHGLIGLRERVTRYGGHLHAAPRPDRSFTLTAALPLHPATGDWPPHAGAAYPPPARSVAAGNEAP